MFRRSHKARSVHVVLKARSWRQAPMRLLKWGTKMPSTKQYNLVTNDDYDTRIPLHSDEAFHYGITFNAKYIGSMEVPRPTSRVEIVAAMRRVRYEFKAKGVKKRKVIVDVSTDGVRVTTRKKKSKGKKKKSPKLYREENPDNLGQEIMHHPIYRIFYVSHDSSDLKIFSYIARDGTTNAFKCNVFKSNKKSQAMRIVRTVGQAFEVCHKMQSDNSAEGAAAVASTSSAVDDNQGSDLASGVHAFKEVAPECESTESCAASTRTPEVVVPVLEEPSRPTHLELLPPPPRKDGRRSPQRATVELPECVTKVEVVPKEPEEATTPLSAQHQLQLLRERLEQQTQQTRAAVAQLLLLRDQLAAEQAARCEAQARTHQLLVHNKELLEHIAALVAHLQEREKGISRPISAQHLTLLPQTAINHGVRSVVSNGNLPSTNRNPAIQNENTEMLVNLISNGNKITQNIENNNVRLHPFDVSPVIPGTPVDGVAPSLSFGEMTNEQVQNYLTTKFQAMTGPKLEPNDRNTQTVSYNQHFFQNSNAFPNIPPLTNHFSNSDIASLLNHNVYGSPKNANGQSVAVDDEMGLAGIPTMNLAQSQNSLYSTSPAATSKDSTPDAFSSDDGALFIMPLSHKGTLTAKCEDGRVKLIVPVSPSGSVSDVGEARVAVAGGAEADGGGSLLRVPTTQIARTTSEKVPNRSEMMTALRSQWTRHTTK